MWTSWLALIGGLALLTWSADRFVLGASATARNLGMSPLLIGMTIMGFGTSAPEILVSTMASLEGNTGLAIGNAVGSNIANIALVLGATALIMPMMVDSNTLRREFPLLLLVSTLACILLLDGELSFIDGVILLAGFVAMVGFLIYLGLSQANSDPLETELAAEIPKDMSMTVSLLWSLAGLALLILSSKMLTWGAINIAKSLGISDLVIGLTIVAIGTSLPELAASIMSAIKKEHDMALGNIIGSNMFNLLAVLGIPGVIHPERVDGGLIYRDLPVMMGLTVLLWLFSYGFTGPGRLNRIEGGVFLISFFAYLTYLYLSTT